MPIVTAIVVDGGFYRRRAYKLFIKKSPQQRARELLDTEIAEDQIANAV
jgi:hypothetical protein